jgi:hypothetical protein
MAVGRSPEGRNVTVTTTALSTAITAPAGSLAEEDAGRTIAGAGIPAGTTLSAVTSDTAATLSAAATAGATVTATIGTTGATAAGAYGFVGWSPETDAESETYSVAAANVGPASPDRITNTTTAVQQRARG